MGVGGFSFIRDRKAGILAWVPQEADVTSGFINECNSTEQNGGRGGSSREGGRTHPRDVAG